MSILASIPRWRSHFVQVPHLVHRLALWGIPRRALLFGPKSLGDDLLCTAVLREASRRNKPYTILTAHPELFSGNDDPARVLPIDDYYIELIRRLRVPVIKPYYVSTDSACHDRDLLPPRHIIAEMCRLAGLTGPIELRPYLQLTSAEQAAGLRFPQQIAIQSSGLAAALPYANKEWLHTRFAEVARFLSSDFNLVQLGSPLDPALPVALDLRGRTTLREAAAVLSSSTLFIGLEGFLTHLARAVDCPSVVVFGGRAKPETFGYKANINLYSPVACAPCGLRNTCAHDHLCMTQISSEVVLQAVQTLTSRSRSPLPVETALLP